MPLNAPPATSSLPSLRCPVVGGSTSANDLVSLRTQVRALLPSTLQPSEAGTNTLGSKEIDEKARRIVELHMERLHEWNEVRDAVQVRPLLLLALSFPFHQVPLQLPSLNASSAHRIGIPA